MTRRTLSEEQIKALDFQTDQLYASFRRAVETQVYQDAVWNKELFEAFGKSLKEATNYSVFTNWNRDTARAQIFDRYLLLYALGNISSIKLEEQVIVRDHGWGLEARATEVTADTLKQAIDNNKVPYARIGLMVMKLAEAHDFAGIVKAMGYVQEKYQPSSLEKQEE